MECDAVVVGAGPAGASAAYWLGEAGKRVLVLEKERLPRYKPCGGGIPTAVLDRFPFDFSPVVEREIGRVRFRFRDGREVVADLPGRPVAMVMRDRFDYHILHHARAEVRDDSPVVALRQDGASVEVETASGETFRGRYLIGADGANSRVARWVGLRRGRRMGAA
ncbi:MAG TPA: FAD-dependent oxidoreductase, partial [Anaerolineales bacterium]|nr:FAD-dependent oxidoreductase [Anaerolineales bacterium]